MVERLPHSRRVQCPEIENFDEPCPDHVTERTVRFSLAARVLHGEAFRMYFEEYDVAHRSIIAKLSWTDWRLLVARWIRQRA